MTNHAPIIDITAVERTFSMNERKVKALRGLDMQIGRGAFVVLMGPSGSGKTTLLNILAGLDRPSPGAVVVGGRDLATLSDGERDEYRRRQVGYALQRVELGVWSRLTVFENVVLPMLGVVPTGRERRDRALSLLEAVGLAGRLTRTPDQLGYGERRRLALAVAMANHPRLLLADEVTAGLDDEAGDRLLGDLSELLRTLGTSAIIVAHGRHLPDHVDRIVPLPYPRPVPADRVTRRSQATRHTELLPQHREVLRVSSVSKTLPGPDGPVEIVRDASLTVRVGEMVAVLGMSGVGKSTLLSLCAGLSEPDAGRVTLAGQDLTALRGEAREALLQRSLGWVMGARPPATVTATESVAVAARIGGAPVEEADRLARVALAATGLEERAGAPLGQMSGGEQARVAVARALVKFPALVIADEPTSQLDILTSTDIIDLLREAADSGIAVLLATHSPVLAEFADRVLVMRDGTLRELRR